MLYSFRCKQCGRLVRSGHAGEHATPHDCPVCKAGVTFDAADVATRDALRDEMVTAAKAGNMEAVDSLMKRLHNLPLKKTIHPDVWEVLADATPERLTELGLTADQVERHAPFKTTYDDHGVPTHKRLKDGAAVVFAGARPEQNLAAVAVDGPASKDVASA